MVGRIIKNYEVRALLEESELGAVYLAENTLRDRSAVLKVPRGPLVRDHAVVERFLADATVARSLGHPNVAEVVDVGRLSDGAPYLMIELLDGETLGSRLQKIGRLPPADAVRIVGEAAAALAVAHDKYLVHGDLKPDNVFLALEPGALAGEKVKLLDFAMAVLHGQLGPSKSSRSFAGSPAYTAPEQCHDGGPVDHRADIYAMGAILYHMVCGVPPFVHASPLQVFVMHVLTPPAPPRRHVPDLPPQLEAVILRALAKKPADRFASMGQLREALGFGQQLALRTPTPVVLPMVPAAPASRPAPSSPFVRVGVTLAGLAVIGGALLWTLTREEIGQTAAAKLVLPTVNRMIARTPPDAEAPVVVVRLDADVATPSGPALVHFQEEAARAAARENDTQAAPVPSPAASQPPAKPEETPKPKEPPPPEKPAPAAEGPPPESQPAAVASTDKETRSGKIVRRPGKQSTARAHSARGRLATPTGPRRQPAPTSGTSRESSKERKRAGKWVEKW
jgi:outer membrane biosynthesis protein TonB